MDGVVYECLGDERVFEVGGVDVFVIGYLLGLRFNVLMYLIDWFWFNLYFIIFNNFRMKNIILVNIKYWVYIIYIKYCF